MTEAVEAGKNNYSSPVRNYREIITKAVCGTVRESLRYTHYIDLPDGVVSDQILGCSVTHQRLNEPKVKDKSDNTITIDADGVYVVQIWYAYNKGKETDVLRCSINFKESFSIDYHDCQNTGPMVARITTVKSPQILESVITDDNRIKLEIELGIYAEVIGESKLLVQVYTPDKN